MAWPILSLIGMGSLTIMVLLINAMNKTGISMIQIMTSLFVFASVFYLGYILKLREAISISPKFVLFAITGGFLMFIANVVVFDAIAKAPNPALPIVIVGFQGAIIAVASVFLFKDKLTLTQGIGILFGIISLILINVSIKTQS